MYDRSQSDSNKPLQDDTLEKARLEFEHDYINQTLKSLKCPITREYICEPMSHNTNIPGVKHVYERKKIKQWVKEHQSAPKTRQALKPKDLYLDVDAEEILNLLTIPTVEYKEREIAGRKYELRVITSRKRLSLQQLDTSHAESRTTFMRKAFFTAVKSNKIDNFTPFKPFLTHYINQLDDSGYSILHYAALQTNTEILDALIKAGANVEAKTVSGRTPLVFAVQQGNLKAVKILLENGANPNPYGHDLIKEALRYKGSPRATIAELDEILKLLFQYGSKPHSSEETKKTPLHYAVEQHGKYERVKFLLEQGFKVNAQDSCGNTPLHYAVETKNNEQIVSLLLNAGADPEIKNNQDLLPSQVINRNDYFYSTYVKSIELISQKQKLLAKEKKLTDFIKSHPQYVKCKFSKLHYAVLLGDKEIFQQLIKDKGNIEAKDSEGRTPLLLAAQNGNKPFLEILLSKRANVDVVDENGSNILHYAASKANNVSMLSFLLELKTNNTINAINNDGNTPLHIATFTNNNEKNISFLLSCGANPLARNNHSLTPAKMVDKKNERYAQCKRGIRLVAEKQITSEQFKQAYQIAYSKAGFFHRNPFDSTIWKIRFGRAVSMEKTWADARANKKSLTHQALKELKSRM